MPACSINPGDRREHVRRVGNDLLKNFGSKQFYSVEEVKAANCRQGISLELCCWSHAAFNSHRDFDTYHQTLGERGDYMAMKAEMLSSVSNTSDTSKWYDKDVSWLELPLAILDCFDFPGI